MSGSGDRSKTIALDVRLDAGPEAVWRAISTAEELRRWFPLDARVEPGPGGSVRLGWGSWEGPEGRITRWQPGERLSWIEQWPGAAEPVAVDFRIETAEGGGVVLRLVQSGFGAGDDWAEYLDVLDSGWRYFLFNLRHYLERHAGKPRRMVWDRRRLTRPKPAVWERLLGPGGVAVTPPPVAEGAGTRLWEGSRGLVTHVTPAIHLACRVPELEEALLFLELEPGGEAFTLGTWLSLYGVEEARARELERTLTARLDRLFGRS